MPELPEVETVVRILRQELVGKRFKDVFVRYEKIIKSADTIESFKGKIIGQEITGIERKGKYIIFKLSNNVLISHLRMEGKYYIFESEKEASKIGRKHVMVEFFMTDGTVVYYHDTRRFGTMDILGLENYLSEKPLNKLGFEPWDEEMSGDYLFKTIHSRKRAIKPTLLDQGIIVGLGNIYVDEVLFRCRIHPNTPANAITKKQAADIVQKAKEVMEFAISLGGTSIQSYTSSLGVSGKFQNELKVHTKEGDSCQLCGTEIVKTRVGGRGTYYCPKCQKFRGKK